MIITVSLVLVSPDHLTPVLIILISSWRNQSPALVQLATGSAVYCLYSPLMCVSEFIALSRVLARPDCRLVVSD